MNWPQAYIMPDVPTPSTSSPPATTTLLIVRGLGPGVGSEIPSAKFAGPIRVKSLPATLACGSLRLLPEPSIDRYCIALRMDVPRRAQGTVCRRAIYHLRQNAAIGGSIV